MQFSFAIEDDDALPYLKVVCQGDARLDDFRDLASITAVASMAKRYNRVLIDLLAVQPHLSFTEHLRLGEHIAGAFAHLECVATVVPVAEKKGASEEAAQKAGLMLKTFVELEAADEWLRAGGDCS